ncbi:hypothetical protein EDC96DRAFT_502152 [Choanephora cucurbitarum]|nr:hypothetical protein EDC96DRAFT_502152 [Choanephora cucurbitarum]
MKFDHISFLLTLLWCTMHVVVLANPSDSTEPVLPRSKRMVTKRESSYEAHRFLRRSNAYQRKTGNACYQRQCALILKPCPKECPQSCGYVNSPDPCCPLLGTAICPKH